MKIIFINYSPDEQIPVTAYLNNKKLAKYFNRETAAAIVAVKRLVGTCALEPETPFYYATGLFEYEDYGLKEIAVNSRDENSLFSQKLFIEKALPLISPLNQFKVLYNMPLCFVSIENNLEGDNAVIYSSGAGLLSYALAAPGEGQILIGAGKVHRDGSVESGFALIEKKEIADSEFLNFNGEAVEMFRAWEKEVIKL